MERTLSLFDEKCKFKVRKCLQSGCLNSINAAEQSGAG